MSIEINCHTITRQVHSGPIYYDTRVPVERYLTAEVSNLQPEDSTKNVLILETSNPAQGLALQEWVEILERSGKTIEQVHHHHTVIKPLLGHEFTSSLLRYISKFDPTEQSELTRKIVRIIDDQQPCVINSGPGVSLSVNDSLRFSMTSAGIWVSPIYNIENLGPLNTDSQLLGNYPALFKSGIDNRQVYFETMVEHYDDDKIDLIIMGGIKVRILPLHDMARAVNYINFKNFVLGDKNAVDPRSAVDAYVYCLSTPQQYRGGPKFSGLHR